MWFIIMLTAMFVVPDTAWVQDKAASSGELTLVEAVMSESIEKLMPVNEAVVFSIELGRVTCFTEFNPVPKQTIIYHKWYHRGRLISQKQLTVNPPRWSSFSSMQLRDTDKGPWQVDITDKNGNLFHTLRFSITD